MFIAVYLYPIFFLILLFPKPSEAAYAAWTTKRQRGKILKMVMELVKDVKMKIKSIRHIRRIFYKNFVYQVGEMIYDIRKKYKRMVFLLHWSERVNKTQKLKNLIEIQQLNMDVDKMIHMIEEYEWKHAQRSNAHERFKYVLRTKEQNYLEAQKKRDALRAQMEKIRNSEKQVMQKQRHMEDGFDTE